MGVIGWIGIGVRVGIEVIDRIDIELEWGL